MVRWYVGIDSTTERARGRTRETGLVERADGTQDLFHARTETTYPRRTIFLVKKKNASIDHRKEIM
jgi:hypothetical protein